VENQYADGNMAPQYFEWMPIRQVEMDDNLRIWRTFSIGTLMDLIMLDTRDYDRVSYGFMLSITSTTFD